MRGRTKRIATLITAALLGGASMTALTFNIPGIKWPGATTRLYVGMSGNAPSGISWSSSLTRAAQEWTAQTPFTFVVDTAYRNPCNGYSANSAQTGFPQGNGDGVNGTDFAATVCGNAFGDNVLAVSLVFTQSNSLGSFDILEGDIVFNSSSRFDIYDGPLNQSRVDFGRVALHEMGHIIGINHEQSSPAIMRATIGNLFTLQADDIQGATTLYNGYANCPFKQLDFGRVSGDLNVNDCSVKQLVGGGSDDSLVDAYEFTLQQTTAISISMGSSSLDSVLVLMDATSRVLEINDFSNAGCDARISRTLPAGTYAVLANTWSGGSVCGKTVGPYRLTMSYQSTGLIEHGRETSLQGATSAAKFAGAVKRTTSAVYSNLVKPTEAFDVVGRITVDAQHQGKPGFIVVAALLDDGEILLRNSAGTFVGYTAQSGIVRASTKVLAATESVAILGNTKAADLGFSDIEVDFLIGYGLETNPNELFFHSAPINLLVSP